MAHSKLPWRSVYPLGSKQRCAAVEAGDHYVSLHVFPDDAVGETIAMHQANADLIVRAVNSFEAMREALQNIYNELDDRYDGAPDSRVLWMGSHMTTIQAALDLANKEQP